MSTLGTKHTPLSTQDEYEALLKEILESDSSDEERSRYLSLTSRNYSSPSKHQDRALALDLADLDLAFDLDLDPTYWRTSFAGSRTTSTSKTFASSASNNQSNGTSNSSTPRSSTYGYPAKAVPVSIVVGTDIPGTTDTNELLNKPSNYDPAFLSSIASKDRSFSLLSLSAPSSVASSSSSSVNTLTRASSVTSSSFKGSQSHIQNSTHYPDSLSTKNRYNSSSFNSDNSLEQSFRRLGRHHQTHHLRQEQTPARYNHRNDSLFKTVTKMDNSNHSSRSQSRGNGALRNGHDASATRSSGIPIILKGSNTRLVNGLQSITSLEQKFNDLRIPELELMNTPETTIKAVLADIYKISEELHMHLQGGPLADTPHHSKKDGNGIVISGETQRQKRIKEVIDRIVRETSLYEEFVRNSNYLSLDAILKEASDEDEHELQGFANLGRDPSEIDSASDIHHEDTLSQASLMSGNHYGQHIGVTSLPGSPLSALSSRSAEPIYRLRPHPFPHTGPGSVASSSAITGRHSHTSSVSFSIGGLNHSDSHSSQGPGAGAEPWETFRWTPLLKLSEQLFSEEIKASSGLGTCIAVSNIIAVGTSRGSVLVYSATQALIGIFGSPQYALEHGSVCSIAISTDNTYMVAGHSLGSIIVWNISKPNVPSRIILPITKEVALSGRKLGHVRGSAVLHVAFVGIKRAEVVSADDQGMSFHHLLYKVMMVNAVETTRLLGKYPAPKFVRGSDPRGVVSAQRQSTVFGMGVLPYGQIPHPADSVGLVALLTPYKMLIVCIKPQPQTLFKFLRPKELQNREGESSAVISGNLAWFPATKSQRGSEHESVETNPMLAFSWNRHLYIFEVIKGTGQTPGSTSVHLTPDRKPASEANGKNPKLDFIKVGNWISREGIVGIQWVRPQILLLLTNTEDIIVFDPKMMCETERCSARSLQIVYHDWFKNVAKTQRQTNSPLALTEVRQPVGDMCYNSSWRVHKGKLFILGVRRVQVGTILNWTDRILALVKSGDFLEGIALATLFYTGKSVQAAVVGLPEDEATRKQMVGEKIYELLTASLNYTFNQERMLDVDADAAAGGVGAGTVLFHDLAIQSIESCLAIEDQGFLFEDVYERYAEASTLVKGIFLQSLEGYILQGRLTEMPPQVMQSFVKYYSNRGLFKELELCICHTPCHVLEMDQIVDLCQRHKLYTGLIYVWNKSIGDYVSPVVELLKVIKSILKERRQAVGSEEAGAPSQIDGYEHGNQDSVSFTDLEDKTPHQNEPSNEEIVHKLYKYLSDSLLGRSYIDGTNLEENEAVAAKVSLYSFIFSGRCVMWPPVGGQLILTGDADDAEDLEPTYPYLRLLLRHDSEEFLKVMDLAFEDSYLASTSRDISQISRNGQEGPGRVMSRQLIINTLLEVLSPSASSFSSTASISELGGNSSSSVVEYSAKDIAHLYSFIARNYAKSPKTIALSPTALHRILTRLSSDTDSSTREERQVAVQALLRRYAPGDEAGMMTLYEQAGFYRVLEKMYRSQKQYGPMVVTFLKDPERRPLVFEAIQKLLDPARRQRITISEKQRTDIVKTAMEHIAEIVDIDGEQSALLVHKYLNAEHRSVLETLHGSKPRLFAYLRGLLEPSNAPTKNQNPTPGDFSNGLTDNGDAIGASSITDPEIHEQYVELLCQYDPSGVYDYLERHQDNSYRLERVLKLCEDAGVVDAVVWILERSGNVGGALGKVLEIVQERIDMLSSLVKSKLDGEIQDIHWSMEEQSNMRASLVRLRGVLNVGKQLCERRSQKVKLLSQVAKVPLQQNAAAQSDTETLWFRLLQIFVAASRKITLLVASKRSSGEKDDDEETTLPSTSNGLIIENAPPALFSNSSPESDRSYNVVNQLTNNFKGFVQSILATLLLSTSTPQVSLPSLLRRLLRSESADGGELNRFSDFKDIFMGMLDTFKYEGQLLEMTNGLFERDLFMGVQMIAKSRAKGWRPRKGSCEICGGAFWGPNIVRELWVQQQRAAANAIKAALATNVTSVQGTSSDSPSSTPIPEGSSATTADVAMQAKVDKDKSTPDKDLLLFRCGHGYHRQCLEMESASTPATVIGTPTQQQQQASSGQDLSADTSKVLNCAICNGMIKPSKARSSSRSSSRPGSRNNGRHQHQRHQQHAMSRSEHRSSQPIKGGWVTLESPQPRSDSSRLSSVTTPPPRPDSSSKAAGKTLTANYSGSNGNGNGHNHGHSIGSSSGGSRPHTPQNSDYQDDRTLSPGPDGYYMSSNEYEAATSPSMKADKGKGKASY